MAHPGSVDPDTRFLGVIIAVAGSLIFGVGVVGYAISDRPVAQLSSQTEYGTTGSGSAGR